MDRDIPDLTRYAGLDWSPERVHDMSESDREWVRSIPERQMADIVDHLDALERWLARQPMNARSDGIGEYVRLRSLVLARSVIRSVDHVWESMTHDEHVRLIEHLPRIGLALPTVETAHGLIGTQLLVGASRAAQSMAGGPTVAPDPQRALMRLPIRRLVEAITLASDLMAAPGQAVKALGLRPKRRLGLF